MNLGIPTFKCKPGCSDCCISVLAVTIINDDFDLIFNGTWNRIGKWNAPVEKCCRVLPQGGCAAYKSRGLLCRLYVVSEMFPECPHGYGPDIKLTIEETKEIMRAIPLEDWNEMES